MNPTLINAHYEPGAEGAPHTSLERSPRSETTQARGLEAQPILPIAKDQTPATVCIEKIEKRAVSRNQLKKMFVLAITVCFVSGCTLLSRAAYAQEAQKTLSELDRALEQLGTGDVISARDVVVIANAGALQAIPALEKQFKRATDVDTKLSIASGLVKLKDRDDTYFNFLLEQATQAIDSNIPNFIPPKSLEKGVSLEPDLTAWADANNVPLTTAALDARYYYPNKVLPLATSGDPRGIPLLRQALQARNFLIAVFGAMGLAEIQDKESVPLIIAAANKPPLSVGARIAETLVYFDDDQAQAAVDALVPREKARLLRQERAKGTGIFGR